MPSEDSFGSDYLVRRLTEADAAKIPELARRVVGTHYAHVEVYDPQALMRLNHEGRLTSVVCLDRSGDVVGHYAFQRHPRFAIAETREAMVLSAHRGHHLMDRMRKALEEAAA